jgi:hypothetical protein
LLDTNGDRPAGMNQVEPPLNKRRQHLLSAVFFAVLVAVLNTPLVLKLDSHVIGRVFDDVFEVLWQLSSVEQALFDTHTNPFFSPHIFYPQGWYTASGAQPPWYFTLLSPLTAFVGPVTTYNLSILFFCIAAGFGAYWFVQRLTNNAFAGLIAGTVYIGAPIFALHMNGFFNMMIGLMLLPFAVGATYVAMTESHSWKWIGVAGIFLAGTILGQWYYLFIATLPMFALILFLSSEIPLKWRVVRFLAILSVAITLVLPFALITLQAQRQMLPEGAFYDLRISLGAGISPDSLLSPNPFHPLWRQQLPAIFPITGERDIVSVGIAATSIALMGLLVTSWRVTRPFVMMALTGLVLGMGLTLRWRGEMVLMNIPSELTRLWLPLMNGLEWSTGQSPIPLPSLLLYHYLPFYSSMRAWARFIIPVILVAAIFAGFGSAWLMARGRKGKIIAVTLWIAIVFESAVIPYKFFTPVSDIERSANQWIASLPPGTSLIEYPRPWVDKVAMYSQALHKQSIVNGYMSFQPEFIQDVDSQLGSWPSAEALLILREWGTDYLVMSTIPTSSEFVEQIMPRIALLDELCLVAQFPDAYTFSRYPAR